MTADEIRAIRVNVPVLQEQMSRLLQEIALQLALANEKLERIAAGIGKEPVTCPTCGGTGGGDSTSAICRTCWGRGTL